MEDNYSKLYKAMVNSGYDTADLGGSEDDFRREMQDSTTRKNFYDWVSNNEMNGFRIGSYDAYEERLAPTQTVTAPQVEAAQQGFFDKVKAQIADIAKQAMQKPRGGENGYTFTAEELERMDKPEKPQGTVWGEESIATVKLPEIKPINVKLSERQLKELREQPEPERNEAVESGSFLTDEHKKAREEFDKGLTPIQRMQMKDGSLSALNAPAIPKNMKYDYDFKKEFGYFPGGSDTEFWNFLKTKTGEEYQMKMFGRPLSDYEIAKLSEDARRLGFWGTVGQGFKGLGYGLKGLELELAEGIADLFGVEHAKENINEERERILTTQDNFKPTAEGVGGFVAEMIPQMTGTGLGLLVSAVNPVAGAAIVNASTAAQVASSMGSTALEARRAGASDAQTAIAMLLSGGAELLSEKYVNSKYIKRIMPKAADVVAEAGDKALESELNKLLQTARKELGGKFTAKTAKDLVGDMFVEGASEFSAEAVQALIPIVYEHKEDFPNIVEVFNAGLEGFAGGVFMGGVLGGTSSLIQSRANNKRRREQGFVDVANVEIDGQPTFVEVLGKDKDGNFIVLNGDETVAVNESQIKERKRFDYDDFRNAEVEYAREIGYELEPTGENAVKEANEYTSARNEVVGLLSLAEDADVDALLEGKTPEEIAMGDTEIEDAVSHYIQARARRDGFRDRYQEERDRQFAESDRSVDATANNGMIYTTTTHDGEKIIITGGKVVLDNEGYIDVNQSEGLVAQFSDGSRKPVRANDLREVVEVSNAEETKAARRAEIEEEWRTEFESAENAYVEQQKRAEGIVFDITDSEGSHRVEVVKEGETMSSILVDGEAMQIPTEELNALREEAGVTQAESTQPVAEGMESEVVTESQPAVEAASGNAAPVQGESGTAPVVEKPKTALELIPRSENNIPLYEQVDSELAWDGVVEEAGGNEETAMVAVNSMIADKQDALKKAEKAKAKAGVTITEKIAAENERVANIEKAKADLAKWEEIAGVKAKRVLAAEAESKRVADEAAAKQRAEEERLRAEREEAERAEREALNGVPDMVDDKPQDAFFNAVNGEDALYIDGVRVDINPITKDKSGTIEQWMNRNAGYSKTEGENAPGQSGVSVSLVKGTKWEKTGEPDKVKYSRKRGDSHDITWYIGKKKYGSTTAERDLLVILAEDYGGDLNAVWNAYEQGEVLLSANEAAILKKLIETNTSVAELQQGTLELDRENPAFVRATKVTMDAVERLKANGLDIEVVSQDEADAMAELAEMEKRTAPETVSVQDEHLQTVVSSADGAKVLKDLDNAINEYEKDVKTKEKTFLGRLAEVLNAKKHGSNSQYATFEAVNGKVFTIRLANHNAKVSTFDNHDENEGISIVVTAQDNNGVTNDGNAHLVEFFYDAIKLRKADGKPLVEILKSIKQALYSGEYKDNTGLAVREEVNIPEMMIVFHGSGAKFDKFDHSFMGTGEGNQAFGWGTYVTEVEGIGRTYATTMRDKLISEKHKENAIINKLAKQTLESSNGNKEEALDYLRGLLNESWSDKKRVKAQIKIIETGKFLPESKVKSNLYTVEIPDDNGSNYLHWDEVVPKKVETAVKERLLERLSEGQGEAYKSDLKQELDDVFRYSDFDGRSLYNNISAYLGGDKAASRFLNEMSFVGISYPANATTGGRADGVRNYVIFNEDDAVITNRVEFLRTANGKVYGWAVDGKIRLTPDGINPNTPVHEYAHLWGADVEKSNPKLWNEVVEAMKLSPVWNEVANDANYSNIHGNDSRMASEVLARLSGRENYRRTMEEAEREIAAGRDIVGKVQKKGILNRIKNALKNFWNWVQRNVFKRGERLNVKAESESASEVMPWEEFANNVVGDFYKGKNPNVKESSLERMAAGEAKKESSGKSAVKNNANFVSTYKTKDGKDIEYTSERAEGYGIQGGGTGNSYDGTGNSILQRQTDTGVPGANSGLNADKGEFCVVERVFTENGAFNFTSGEKIESADDVAYIFSALEDAAKEHSFVVYVKDGKPTVIELGMGSFNATMVDIPTASLAYSRISPDHVYFVHNHPSGDLVCSDQDVAMLRVFEDMSDVPVTGVIINLKTGKYGTFDTERHSVIGEKRVPENEERLTVHTLDKKIFAPDYDPMAQPLVRSSQDVAQFLNSQRMGDRPKVSFLILSRANRIIGNIHTPFTDITTDTEAVARYINERIIQFGGENAILYGDFAISMDESRGFRLLQGAMERFGKTKLLDVVHVEGNFTKSAIDLGLLYEPEMEYNVAKENEERYNSPEQDIPVEEVQTQPLTFAEKITNSVLEASASKVGQEKQRPVTEEEVIEQQEENETDIARDAVTQLGEALNAPVTIVDDLASLPENRRNKKGWFDPKTGEVVVVMPNHVSSEDAVQTVLHEVVGHRGLRAVLGDKFDEFLDDVYRNASPKVKRGISDKFFAALRRGHALTVREATEEYIAGLAERGLDGYDSVWNGIKQWLKDAFRGLVGFEVTDNELRYLLWKSYNRQKRGPIGAILDIAMEAKTGTGNTMFRVVEDYNKDVQGVWNSAKEGWYDEMRSVKVAQEAIEKELGREVLDSENVYLYANHLPSINKNKKEVFDNKYLKPFTFLLKRLYELEVNGQKMDEKSVERYANAKHGIERNREMSVKRALTEVQDGKKVFNETAYAAWAQERDAVRNRNLPWAEEQRELDKIAKKYGAEIRDYSGLTAIFDAEGKMKYAQIADAAYQYVEDVESVGKSDIKKLWALIKGMTDYSLKEAYESGMMSKSTYEHIKQMYRYYVPLRGFTEQTAEDFFDYVEGDHSPLNAVVKTAKGRTSEAENIFATILNMANSAIVQGSKNRLKQRLLNLALHSRTGLLSVDNAWYKKVGDEYVPVEYPESADEYAAFEERMKELEKNGEVMRHKPGLEIGRKVAQKWNETQHAVRVKRNGREYIVWVNGDPRLANAINGMLRENFDETWIGAVNRWRAQMVTQYSPTFIFTNLARDVQEASMTYAVRRGMTAMVKFDGNVKDNTVKMMSLYRKYKKGTLDENIPVERYFKEFLENGGETGYTEMISIEEYEKKLKKLTEGLNMKNATGRAFEAFGDGVEFANRCIENLCRFSAYQTSREAGMSILKSIEDAKEVSVNFNRKGSGAMGQKWAKALYMFLNPAIQSLAKRILLTKKFPKKMAAVWAGEFVMGATAPLLWSLIRSMFGDDEDELMGNYFNLTDYRRRSGLCLPGKDGVFHIPLSHEARAMYGLGELFTSYVMGHEEYDNIPIQVFNTLSQSLPLNPLDGWAPGKNILEAMFYNLTPDAAKPIAEVVMNRDFAGNKIHNRSDFNEFLPEYMRGKRGTADIYKSISKVLSGKEIYGKGFLDNAVGTFVNPSTMEHLIEGYLGGAYTFADKAIKTGKWIFGNEEYAEFKNVPILSTFYTSLTKYEDKPSEERTRRDWEDAFKFYQQEVKYYDDKETSAKNGEKNGEESGALVLEQMERNGEVLMVDIFNDGNDRLKELYSASDVARRNKEFEKVQEIDKQIYAEKKEIVERMEKLADDPMIGYTFKRNKLKGMYGELETYGDVRDENIINDFQKELQPVYDEYMQVEDWKAYKKQHEKEINLYRDLDKKENDISKEKSLMKEDSNYAQEGMAKIRTLRAEAVELIKKYRNE